MSSNSYRIRTTVGGGENVINVNLKQKVKTLNILSLEIEPEDEYDIHTSDYGVIVGRVLANNAFGVPNVKVSVFIPISSDDESDYVISNEYPYKTPQSKDINGVKYNLVLKKKDGPGTFVDKNTMLDNEGYREVYDKYWTYTTTTNQSGDYMIFGVPTGSTQIHYDCDLSDIGMLSQHPYDLVAKGYDANLFDSMNEFTAKDLNSAVHIISQDKTVYVYPFWGDKNANKIGITRADIDLNYKFEPSCVFMGSSITDPRGSYIGVDGQPNGSNGRFNSLTTSVGDIEIIRKTQNGRVEELKENVVGIIDGNGVWCYQIPMNLDRIGTDEYGNTIAINDPERGIPTRARVRFRISLTDAKDESASEYTAKFLIPCNPPLAPKSENSRSAIINHEVFSDEDWDNIYEFGDKTPDSCFRDLYWGKVYSVKQYYLRYQYEYEPKTVGYGDKMVYETNEDFNKPNQGYTFMDYPYVGDNTDVEDRQKEQQRQFDYSNYPTRNTFKFSCISSIDNINGLNPFPYNTMYAGAEEHINDGTIYWFRYHFTNESSDSSYPSKGLHFCFENDWVNGCLYFPRIIINRTGEADYDYFGQKTDNTEGEVSESDYYPYIWISGRHDYRLPDNSDNFVLPENLKDIFNSRWVWNDISSTSDDDMALISWPFTSVYEELFYAFSRCRMLSGTLTKKKTMIGQDVFYYRCGFVGRKKRAEMVDLGLRSGTLWAKCNLGAEEETETGDYYQWGDYLQKISKSFNENHYVWYFPEDYNSWYGDRYTKYNQWDSKTTLDNEDDAVYAATNGQMMMPTKEQLEELINETNHEWVENFEGSGVNGIKFMNTDDVNKYIFIPAAGYYNDDNDLINKGDGAYIWSTLREEDDEEHAYDLAMYRNEVVTKEPLRVFGLPLRGVGVAQADDKDYEEEYRRMYATDIILLGNLEDIYDSLPKLYESLPATTATFPPIAPPESLSEAGMTWAGYPNQLDQVLKEDAWDDRCDIFGNTKQSLGDDGDSLTDKVLGYDTEYAQAYLNEAITATTNALNEQEYSRKYFSDNNQYVYNQGATSVGQIAVNIFLNMLNRRYGLFFGIMNSGGISAFLSYVPAAFVNLSRICELDVHNDAAFKTLQKDITVTGDVLSDNYSFNEAAVQRIIPINGMIDAFDIATNENRSYFASMNYDINKHVKGDFVYNQYAATPMSVSSFDGRLQMLIDEKKTYGLMYPSDVADDAYVEFRFRNPYMSQNQKRIMHIFRAYFNDDDLKYTEKLQSIGKTGDTDLEKVEEKLHMVNYCNDHLILTENSFYFYFGLRSGFSAIDRLREKFIGKLQEVKRVTNPLVINKLGQFCQGDILMTECSISWRNMTSLVTVSIYQDNSLEFNAVYENTSSINVALPVGLHMLIVRDESGQEYQKYFSLSESRLDVNAVAYINELTELPELTIESIEGQPVTITSYSGQTLLLSSESGTYQTKCIPGFSGVTEDGVVIFNSGIDGVTLETVNMESVCFKGETYITFKHHTQPQLELNNVPVSYIKNWQPYNTQNNNGNYEASLQGTPDSIFSKSHFYVWDSINSAHPGMGSERTYDFSNDALRDVFDELSYVSNMCSCVFGGTKMQLVDTRNAETYTPRGIYLSYHNLRYSDPATYWGENLQEGFYLHTVRFNQPEPNVLDFRRAPHIVGTNYPRRSNNDSKRTFLKNSGLAMDGSLGKSGYTNNQLYTSQTYGATGDGSGGYFGSGIFGIYLFGLNHNSINVLDKPGALFTDPTITTEGNNSFYLENKEEPAASGITNYYGVRTVDKRMDYQFAIKTPLILPSGTDMFTQLTQKNLFGGQMTLHLYGGFRLNYNEDYVLTSFSEEDDHISGGPDFNAKLYSVKIYEDNNTNTNLSYQENKQRIWGYSSINTKTKDDVDYVIYTIGEDSNMLLGNQKINLTFTDCSKYFSDNQVHPGDTENLSLSYESPVKITLPESHHIHYEVSVGGSGYTASLIPQNLSFNISNDSLWNGETYTHSNVTGQTNYSNGCDDAVYQATNGAMRMPTKEQLEELIQGTSNEAVGNFNGTGVYGWKFTNRNDENKYIFIPAGGFYDGMTIRNDNQDGYIWSASRGEDQPFTAYSLIFYARTTTKPNVATSYRYYGFNVRGVAPSGSTLSDDYVDLGLSGGTLWAKCNLGARTETDFGLYYQWGDINGHAYGSGYSFDDTTYIWGVPHHPSEVTKYNGSDSKTLLDVASGTPWVQTYSNSVPYSGCPDISLCVCEPNNETDYRVTQVLPLEVKYYTNTVLHYNNGTFIVPYKHTNANDLPITNEEAEDEYYYQVSGSSEIALSSNAFLMIPTKTNYSSLVSSFNDLKCSLKQGVSYNLGNAYFAGGVTCLKDVTNINKAIIQLNTPLRQPNGDIDFESDSLKNGTSWHTIGNISNYWSETGNVTYNPEKIEFTYSRGGYSTDDNIFFTIENGLTYKIDIIFPTNE